MMKNRHAGSGWRVFSYVYIYFSLYGRKTDRKKGVSRTVWDCGKLAEFSTFPYLL